MCRALATFFLSIFLLFSCTSIPVPPGIDNDIFNQTKKITSHVRVSENITRTVSSVEGPSKTIDDNPNDNWSLFKFKDKKNNIRYRLLYQCYGIWVGQAKELNSGISLTTDLLMQDDLEGFVLETGAVDLDRELLDQSLDSGLKILLISKGEGTVVTATPEMKRAEARDDWKTIGEMINRGECYKSKYVNKSVTIEVPSMYLKAFLAKADAIEI